MAAPASRALDDESRYDALQKELSRVYERLGSDPTTSILQFIALVLAGGIVAAERRPEVFALVPVMWSGWMLHALVIDLDTRKYSLYAAVLEEELNELLGRTVYRWESVMTARTSMRRPAVFWASWAYWGALNATAWVIGIALCWRENQHGYAWALSAAAVALYAVVAWTVLSRPKYDVRVRAALSR